MKYFRYSLILILFFSIVMHIKPVEASNGDSYEVGANILHVRSEPTSNATIVGTLQKGDQLTIFQEKYGWVQTYYAGQPAWVAKHYLVPKGTGQQVSQTKTSTVTATNTSNQVTVTASSVNIRSGPGLGYQVVAGTSQGNVFKTIETSGDWIKISLANGHTGWIASWLTSTTTNTATNVQPVAAVKTKQTSASGSLAGYTIVLDAGHGGRDPGAIGLGKIHEKDLVLSTTKRIAQTLRTYGANVIETRSSDYYLSLDERTHISNAYNTDAFISVHYNSFPVVSVQGINTHYYSNAGYELARNVHSSLASAVSLNNRGLVQENYKVLRNTNAPAILLELGFISNHYDLSVIQTADFQNQAAQAVANGLLHYFH